MKRSCQRIAIRSKLRLLAAVVAMVSPMGCRAPAPPSDPFLYRSTIPPPGTITPMAPPAGQPYYPAAPPGATTVPPTISPGTPIAPSAAPITPAPASPAPSNNRYGPPGGFNYQGSLRSPATLVAPASFAAPPAPVRPADSGVVAAGNWQPPKASQLNDTGLTPMASWPTSPKPEPSVVRIVEPAKPAEQPQAAAPASTTPPATTTAAPTSAAPAAPSPGPTATNSAPTDAARVVASMPVTISNAPVTISAATQTVDRPAVPEITDLPAVATATSDRVKPADSASAAAPVTIPAERPGASYGYDPDYKTLRGKLEYSVASRRWKLSYLPVEGPIDEFGGNVVLPDANQLQGFEAGDFVVATGTFSAPTAANGPAMFAIQRIKRQ